MFQSCNKTNVTEFVAFVYEINLYPEHSSAFCSKNYHSVLTSFMDSMDNKDHIVLGYYDNNSLVGVIEASYDSSKLTVDCAGPFINRADYNPIAILLFNEIKKYYPKQSKYQFFFDERNQETMKFLERIKAIRQGDESIYVLYKSDFIPQESDILIRETTKDDLEALSKFHDSTFIDAYLSGENIKESFGKNRLIYQSNDYELIRGYGILNHKEGNKRALVEVIAVHQSVRRQGYGSALLNYMIQQAFLIKEVEEVQLVVENSNYNAISLYEAFGFKKESLNLFYAIST
jgi:ribosomal protein S18 acetylase RimI-like enzyme